MTTDGGIAVEAESLVIPRWRLLCFQSAYQKEGRIWFDIENCLAMLR